MTVPFERTRALVYTKEFLEALLDPKVTPRVPRRIRAQAKHLLRHYPTLGDIHFAHQASPEWFGPVPLFSRVRCSPVAEGLMGLRQMSDVVPLEGLKPGAGKNFSAGVAETMPVSPLIADLVRAGQLLQECSFIEKMKWTQHALGKALAASRLFFIEADGVRYFPAFYTDQRYDRTKLGAVCKALCGAPGGAQLQFFSSRKGSLCGKTPLEALEQGQMAAVLAAAQAFAEG